LKSEKIDFFDLIATRHSIRAYKQKNLSKDIIKKILSASQKAPSAGNIQSYEIFVVSNDNIKKRLAKAAHDQNYIIEAPNTFVFCADPQTSAKEYGNRGIELFSIQDATLACAYAQLASHALGLSSVWIGAFNENEVSTILNVGVLRPVAMLVVGFANEKPEITNRRPLGEIIHEV
jgi:nitroreductase